MKNNTEIYVEVSAFVPRAWFDPLSRMWFAPNSGTVKIPIGTNITNINRYLKIKTLVNRTAEINRAEVTRKINDPKPSSPNQLLREGELQVRHGKAVITEEPVVKEKIVKHPIVPKDKRKLSDKVNCKYCGKEFSRRGIKAHEKACKDKPE